MKTTQKIWALALILIAIIGMWAAFRLPYKFPSKPLVVGASYDYGFNNSVGILIVIFLATIFFVSGLIWRTAGFKSIVMETRVQSSEQISSWKEFRLLALISLLLISAMAFLSDNSGFGESIQFFLAIEKLNRGEWPYKDFDFYYGPLLIYLPWAISKILSILGCSVKIGYFFSLGLLQVGGLWELGYVLSQLALESKTKRLVFLFIGLSSLPIHSGINLILFRYVTPITLFIMLQQFKSVSLNLRLILLALSTLMTFGVSVEYGIIFFVVTSFVHILAFIENRLFRELISIAVCINAVLLIWFLYPGLFGTIYLYSTGAWGWPFIESLSLIFLFVSVCWLAFAVGVQMKRPLANRIDLSICLMAFGSLPAALGRCDPGHILFNGIGIFTFSYCYILSIGGKKLSACYGSGFILIFGFMTNISSVGSCRPIYALNVVKWISNNVETNNQRELFLFGGRLLKMSPVDVERKIEKFQSRKAIQYEQFFEGVDSVACPFMTPYEIKAYLQISGKYKSLYFKDYQNLASSKEVFLAIKDLAEKMPSALLLPAEWFNMTAQIDYSSQIDILFFSNYQRKPVRNGQTVFNPLVSYVNSNYIFSDQAGGLSLWKRKLESQ